MKAKRGTKFRVKEISAEDLKILAKKPNNKIKKKGWRNKIIEREEKRK